MNAKPTKEAPPAAPRTFTFDRADFSEPIPDDPPKPPSARELPFKKRFEEFSGEALAGKRPHLFVPHAYWTEARDVAKDVKGGLDAYSRTKLRDQFNKWRSSAVEKKPELAALSVVVVPRTGKEDPKIAGIAEPGISIWVRKG